MIRPTYWELVASNYLWIGWVVVMYFRLRRCQRGPAYRPNWHPAVRSNEDTGDVRVVIQKAPSPRQQGLPKAALEIGTVRITDQDFDTKLVELVSQAEDKAAAMTVAQSTTGQYGHRESRA